MKISELLNEVRRNAQVNQKESVYDFVKKHATNPNAYLHTTSVEKVGIYPKSSSSHDSPIGIYAYRLMDIPVIIERFKDPSKITQSLPYYGGSNFYILESNIDHNFPKNYTEEDLDKDIEKIKKLYKLSDNQISTLKRSGSTIENFRNIPASYLWGMTKALSIGNIRVEMDRYTSADTKKWNSILRRLGHKGFNDPGYGVIHAAEPSQALFLSIDAVSILDHMETNRKQSSIEVDGKTYKGGHAPKVMNMKSIPNTFMYNYEPSQFSHVRQWNIEQISISDFRQFIKFISYNSKLNIGTLYFPRSNDSVQTSLSAQTFFKYTPPKNVNIDKLMAYNVYGVARHIPPSYPVKTILLHDKDSFDNYKYDALSDEIKNKVQWI